MKVGRFIIQVDNRYPSMIKNWRKLLGDRRSMSDEQWKALIAEQLDKYYTEPFNYETLPLYNEGESYNPFETNSQPPIL